MTWLRTLASALCIILGSLLLAVWAAATTALTAIEGTTVVEDAASRAIASEPAQEVLVSQGSDLVLKALDTQGVNTDIPGLEFAVRTLVEAVVSSEEFAATVNAQVKSVRQQLVEELNTDGTGPIVVTVDVSDQVNIRLEQIPVVGPSLPDITVPGFPVQVMDAETADSVRGAWDWLHFAQDWCGWLGLALLALGLLASHRRRWYLAKAALAIAIMSGIGWLVFANAEATDIVSWIPGEGILDQVVIEVFRHDAVASIERTLGFIALGAMIVAVILFIIAARSRGSRKGSP